MISHSLQWLIHRCMHPLQSHQYKPIMMTYFPCINHSFPYTFSNAKHVVLFVTLHLPSLMTLKCTIGSPSIKIPVYNCKCECVEFNHHSCYQSNRSLTCFCWNFLPLNVHSKFLANVQWKGFQKWTSLNKLKMYLELSSFYHLKSTRIIKQ